MSSSLCSLLAIAPVLLLLMAAAVASAHPILVECVCATTAASDVVLASPTPASKGQAAKFVLPSCLNDVFAETGIRWYVNGPYRGDVAYWRREPKPYATGRAAQRLMSLGYNCTATQLYDPNELEFLT
ncbi:hypothetical protein ATCC90586_010246 [Pythium insidiosum]|nr:hypothetical protein ATCC90586_010246 [Pythium insidiosum]